MCLLCLLYKMASFDGFDDDYGDLFITQSSKEDSVVSLEENGEFKTVTRSPGALCRAVAVFVLYFRCLNEFCYIL